MTDFIGGRAFWAPHPWPAPKMPIQNRIKVFYKENSSRINEIKDDLYFSFKESLTFGNSRYKTKFPFKKYNEILPDNFYLPKIWLNTLKTCLEKNENLMIEYNKIIKQYINHGIVEPVRSTTASYDLGSVHYLPHRAVVRQNRDTITVRIVFDTSAHVDNEPSLNDALYCRTCMLPLLHDILTRFWIGKVGIVADVQQAFLQIEIDEKHRDFLRFIGFDNIYYITTHHMFYYVLQEMFSV